MEKKIVYSSEAFNITACERSKGSCLSCFNNNTIQYFEGFQPDWYISLLFLCRDVPVWLEPLELWWSCKCCALQGRPLKHLLHTAVPLSPVSRIPASAVAPLFLLFYPWCLYCNPSSFLSQYSTPFNAGLTIVAYWSLQPLHVHGGDAFPQYSMTNYTRLAH